MIYIVYYAVYEYFFLRYIKKQMMRQQTYLEGMLAEKDKYYNYNKRKFYD